MIKNFLNPEGHQNRLSGSKVTAFSLKGRILPIGGASLVEGLRSTGLPRLVLLTLTHSIYGDNLNDLDFTIHKSQHFVESIINPWAAGLGNKLGLELHQNCLLGKMFQNDIYFKIIINMYIYILSQT